MLIFIPDPEEALPGRHRALEVNEKHFVNGNPIKGKFQENIQVADFAMGCFWGAERKYWELESVFSTAVGYMGGYTPNATYEEVCSGLTGHAEVVRVFFDSSLVKYKELLKVFWESHNPTQGMRQGNDIGTQYRSAIYFHNDEQKKLADQSLGIYNDTLQKNGHTAITTEIKTAEDFYYAEDNHQQYLAKNPNGYCGMYGTGLTCLI
ncbi:MAG: peptide-methionine (S)-S-oxide reductase MsrA [Pseudomonadota bacterium]|nr:peptide-methionine (S)-S-oxide reductase MsrA [Pseudomonadota bacterium]